MTSTSTEEYGKAIKLVLDADLRGDDDQIIVEAYKELANLLRIREAAQALLGARDWNDMGGHEASCRTVLTDAVKETENV